MRYEPKVYRSEQYNCQMNELMFQVNIYTKLIKNLDKAFASRYTVLSFTNIHYYFFASVSRLTLEGHQWVVQGESGVHSQCKFTFNTHKYMFMRMDMHGYH